MLFDINFSEHVSSGKTSKSRNKKIRLHQTKKPLHNKIERVLTKWEKIFANITSNKGLILNIYK